MFKLLISLLLTIFINCQTTTELNEEKETSSLARVEPASPTSDSLCSSPLPGLESMIQGIDITRFDLYHDYSLDNVDGFAENLFTLTCAKRRKIVIMGKEYDVPDQVQSVKPLSQEVALPLLSDVRLFDDIRILKNYLSSSVGLSRTASKGWFSESSTYSALQVSMINSSRSLLTMDASYPLFTISMPSKIPLRRFLSEFLSDYVNQELPDSYEDGPERYLEFFRTYGTHYFKSASLGGKIKFWTEIRPTLRTNMSRNSLIANARSTYLSLLSESGATLNSSQLSAPPSLNSSFVRLSSTYSRIFGGDLPIYKTRGSHLWRDSLKSDPKVINGQLSPITDLIREDHKRHELLKALDVYLGLSYLQESRRLLDIYLVMLPLKVKENIEGLIKKIDVIQKKEPPSYETIKQLMDEL